MSTEPRRIKRLVRKLPRDPLAGKRPVAPFPDVPAGHTRRGAITTQKVEPPSVQQGTLADRKERVHHYAHTKPRVVEGYVTLSQLAAERGIQAQLARIWVQKAEIPKPADGWRWKADSKPLKRVRKALGLAS